MSDTTDIRMSGINWRRGALRLWIVASVLWCLAVFSISLLENEKANQSQTTIAAPGCKDSASVCKPWQRDWSTFGDLKAGAVVIDQGTVTQPDGVSVREAVFGATPWAVAPPIAALVMGASLVWAFAGFRRVAP